MNKVKLNKTVIGLIFTIYSFAVLAVFNPFSLISSQALILSLLEASSIIFVLFITFNLLSKIGNSGFFKKSIFITSFFIVPLLTAILTYIVLDEENKYFTIYVSSFIVFSLLPLSLAILFTIFKDLQHKIIISSETVEKDLNDPLLKLMNDKGKILLQVKLSNIICFEANDNYVITYFRNTKGEMEKSMERISLKKIEEILIKLEANFQRVHKSYIVNPIYVLQVHGKAQSHKLKLEELAISVPVSRNFDVSIFSNN